jgi:hypothetical protein
MSPNIGTFVGDTNRNIPNQRHTTPARVYPQQRPLAMELKLEPPVVFELRRVGAANFDQRSRLAVL